KNELPTYASQISDLKKQGARLMTVFGVGRVCHIAFWEPHFAAEFASEAEWKQQTHRLGARLHPLTIEQNALTSFRSRTTLVPAFANTIGPALFLAADRIIGGADGTFGRGMQWQGLSLRMTLQHEPTPWIPRTHIPTPPRRVFLPDRAGPAAGRGMPLTPRLLFAVVPQLSQFHPGGFSRPLFRQIAQPPPASVPKFMRCGNSSREDAAPARRRLMAGKQAGEQ